MKTATIERYHLYGTMRHMICARYRGDILFWWTNGHRVFADAPFYGQDSIDAMKDHARKQGFTHVRFVGDWDKWTKPHGGAIVGGFHRNNGASRG